MRSKEEFKHNRWEQKEDLTTVITTICKLAVKKCYKWTWVKNWNCKYIDIRIDMRDGAFIIKNNKGERITLDELKHQREYDE